MKSFRDRTTDFPVYDKTFDRAYLNSLGPLTRPTRHRSKENPASPDQSMPMQPGNLGESAPQEQLGRMFLRNGADKSAPTPSTSDPTTMMGK